MSSIPLVSNFFTLLMLDFGERQFYQHGRCLKNKIILDEKFSVIAYFPTDVLFWGVKYDQHQYDNQQEELGEG